MAGRRRFRKRAHALVAAVQLRLDTGGFTYRKWGGEQTCKPDDWIVDNNGDVYTVDAGTFGRTYRPVSPGQYRKTATVWAEVSDHSGAITTREGTTHYEAGWYLVWNDEEGQDCYAVSGPEFEAMYEPADERSSQAT